MPTTRNEAQIQLALQALEYDLKISVKNAAKLYRVSKTTLIQRRKGTPSRTDIIANSRKLDSLEEEVIVHRILDLDEQGFSPGLNMVEDIANLLLDTRHASRVGKH
jgi:hypothetical protein